MLSITPTEEQIEASSDYNRPVVLDKSPSDNAVSEVMRSNAALAPRPPTNMEFDAEVVETVSREPTPPRVKMTFDRYFGQ